MRVFSLLFLTCSLLGQGCVKRPNSPRWDALAAETDALGRRVSVREYPRRIVSLAPSNTEMLLFLGLRDKLVGVTSFYGAPEKLEGVAKIGGYINPSVAKVISLHPDLVFAARGNSRDAIEQLRRQGINVFTLDTRTVSGLLADIKKVGALTGRLEEARRLTGEIESEIREICQKVAKLSNREKPKVFWIGQEEPLRTAGPGSLVDELIGLAGGVNVAREEKSRWPSFSMEKLVLRDPEVIILGDDNWENPADRVAKALARFRKNRVWRNISAVKKGRVYYIPTDVLGQPSPAFVVGLKILARRLHPALFPELPGEKARAGDGESK